MHANYQINPWDDLLSVLLLLAVVAGLASPQSLTGLWSWWSRSPAAVVFVLLCGVME